MDSSLNHLQVNVDAKNLAFYRDLMNFLGWKNVAEDEDMAAFSSNTKASLWFVKKLKDITTDYDGTGVNHIGIGVDSVSSVDKTAEFLKAKGVEMLFGTPKSRPEFTSAGGAYYQIMFESPDKILFEIVFAGPV